MKTIPIIGLPVAATTYAGAVAWILERAQAVDRAYAEADRLIARHQANP